MMGTVGDRLDPQGIAVLRSMIDDEEYLSDAVRRIASMLTDRILGIDEPTSSDCTAAHLAVGSRLPGRDSGAPHGRERRKPFGP